MEDLNMIAADCLGISCCCQCLILQLLIFVLLRLPYKLFRKTRQYVKKLRDRKKKDKIVQSGRRSREWSFRVHMEGCLVDGISHGFGCCMDEVEKVLEEFSLGGEFAFGSFWGGEISSSFPSCLADSELDYAVVHCHLIQVFGSFKCRETVLDDVSI